MEALWQSQSAANGSPEKASRAKRPKRGWRYPSRAAGISSAHSRKPLGRAWIGGGLGILTLNLLNPLKKSHKHPALVAPVVVAEHVLVQDYYGNPPAVSGVLLATFLGYLLGKSMLETGGSRWAWLIHWLQDVIIFSFLVMSWST